MMRAQPYRSSYFLQQDNSESADEQDPQVYDTDRERKTLSKLTVDQLIHLKQAVANGRVKEAWEAAQGNSPRKWKFPTKRDDGWWPEYEEESHWKPSYYESEKKGKEGGLDKFFYTTISILSFLAFGGYILCLIIQAVRRVNNGVTIVTTTVATTAAGRRKRSLLQDPTTALPFIDNNLHDTYSALISLSEAYAKYENLSRAGIPVQP